MRKKMEREGGRRPRLYFYLQLSFKPVEGLAEKFLNLGTVISECSCRQSISTDVAGSADASALHVLVEDGRLSNQSVPRKSGREGRGGEREKEEERERENEREKEKWGE
jgi:hypothetical protein